MNGSVYETRKINGSCWEFFERGVRSFLVIGAKRAMVVDSGFGGGNLLETVSGMTDLPIMLVNTHADPDHMGCNGLFERAWMHPAEYDRYRRRGGSGPVSPLWEGDVVDLGGRSFEVILIPGHTPGSIALLDRENQVLFSGDSVQDGGIYMFGEGRSLPAYIDSMKKLQAMKEQFDTVYPSHGALPLSPGIIDGLLEGAEKLARGELQGVKPQRDVPALEYDVGVAQFLYGEGNA